MIQLPRKLVLRIAIIALANLAVFFTALVLIDEAQRRSGPRTPFGGEMKAAIELQATGADPERLARELQRLAAQPGFEISAFRSDGSLIARTAHGPILPKGVRPGNEPVLRPLGPVGNDRLAMVVPLGESGKAGTAVLEHPNPRRPWDRTILFPGLLAVLTVFSSLLVARWLLRPLVQLSAFAREFGAGNMEARVRIGRREPFGPLAATFDEMAERLTALMNAQKELLANVSHELRTPLARIRVALDLAAESSPQEAAASLSGIAGDLAELERLTQDILTSARLELPSARPPLRVARIHASALLEDAAERFRSVHPATPLRLENGCDGADVEVDRMMLRRALDNLLDNAVKHADASAEVVLEAKVADRQLTPRTATSRIAWWASRAAPTIAS
jgi:signal transduction histidine kinase